MVADNYYFDGWKLGRMDKKPLKRECQSLDAENKAFMMDLNIELSSLYNYECFANDTKGCSILLQGCSVHGKCIFEKVTLW